MVLSECSSTPVGVKRRVRGLHSGGLTRSHRGRNEIIPFFHSVWGKRFITDEKNPLAS